MNWDIDLLFSKLRNGDTVALAKAITLLESKKPEHRLSAEKLLNMCLPFSGNSLRIGVTGIPGAGKSTFIEYYGMMLIREGKKVAVLAVDPSSTISRGSILGDKTRMEKLAVHPDAFVRPTPSGSTLGGVAARTAETVILCEAAGFNRILIETVGVGQSETEVRNLCDIFILLVIAGAGDELQGIKRGIMELVDIVLVNKCEEPNTDAANRTAQQLRNALHLFPPGESGIPVDVLTVSAFTGQSLDDAAQRINFIYSLYIENNGLLIRRREMEKKRLENCLKELIWAKLSHNIGFTDLMEAEKSKLLSGKTTAYSSALSIVKSIGDTLQ
jgi:LAO/AO transport system kinase